MPGEGTKSFGETTATEDLAFEKESWRVKGMIRCAHKPGSCGSGREADPVLAPRLNRSLSGKEIYDLAWSPCGTRILAGSVDHTATIYCTQTCSPLYRLAEHTNYVQGVAWDPRGGYIATQSSDRTMHVYEVKEQQAGQVEVHAVGRNSRMEVAVPLPNGGRPSTSRSSSATRPTARTLSTGASAHKSSDPAPRPSMPSRTHSAARSDASSSEASSSTTTAATSTQWPAPKPSSTSERGRARSASGAAGSVEEITTSMDPPQGIPHHPPAPSPSPQLGPTTGRSHSRRSSASGSATGMSPRATVSSSSSRPLRSPSPAPLPAVMPAHSPSPRSTETPAFASSSAGDTLAVRTDSVKLYSDANSTHFFRRLAWSPDGALLLTPAGLWEDPYTAASMQAAVASGAAASRATSGTTASTTSATTASTTASEPKPTVYIYSRSNIARPPVAHLPGHRTTSLGIRFCPVLWQLRDSDVPARGRRPSSRRGSGARAAEEEDREQEVDEEEEENAVSVQLSTDGVDVPLGSTTSAAASEQDKGKGPEVPSGSTRKPKSLFDLPYRMVYAVATLDSVYLYDTQQAGPLAMFGNLHYAPFTDLTWCALSLSRSSVASLTLPLLFWTLQVSRWRDARHLVPRRVLLGHRVRGGRARYAVRRRGRRARLCAAAAGRSRRASRGACRRCSGSPDRNWHFERRSADRRQEGCKLACTGDGREWRAGAEKSQEARRTNVADARLRVAAMSSRLFFACSA